MSHEPRPVLLGYIRADVLRSPATAERAEAQLVDFADREEFSLGTVYVERGDLAAAFHSLMAELVHDDTVWGLVVPDLRHLADGEQQVLRRHAEGVRTRIVVANFSPRSGGPGAESPARARSAVPPPPAGRRDPLQG
jgi:hypothetical protein